MKLSEALAQFTEWGSGNYSARTIDTYSDLLRRFFEFVGDRDIKSIEINHISKYILDLKKRGYASSSIAQMVISVRVFFKYLFMRRMIKWNYELIGIPKYETRHFPTVKKDEALAMMKNVQVKDFQSLRDAAIQRFFYATGVRVSELCDLFNEDVDLDNGEVIITTKKSKKRRMVPLDAETIEIMARYLKELEQWAKDEYVFISLDKDRQYFGKRITPRSVQRIIKKYRLPGSRVVPHSYRSGLITDFLENNVSLRVIQEALGHSTIFSLEPYARVHNPFLKKEYKRVRG